MRLKTDPQELSLSGGRAKARSKEGETLKEIKTIDSEKVEDVITL